MTTDGVQGLRRYRAVAAVYDLLSGEWPIYGVGRDVGVATLRLRPGDTVLDVGCGTGLSFPSIERAVGPAGRILGIDASPEMLDRARRRANRNGWANVELLRADAGSMEPAQLAAAAGDRDRPRPADAVLFVYALSLVPNWRSAWRRAVSVARPGARVAVVDLGLPGGRAALLSPLARVACALGGSDPHAHPWTALQEDADDVEHHSLWGGHVQVAAGTVPTTASTPIQEEC